MDWTLVSTPPDHLGSLGRGLASLARLARTIRGRILVAFLVMAVITGALGSYAALQLKEAGELATRTFDQSLMSVNYARAALADFTAMENAFIRCAVETDPAERDALGAKVEEARVSLLEDLTIAGERAQSRRAIEAGDRAKEAVSRWNAARGGVAGRPEAAGSWRSIDGYAATVNQQIDLLVNYTAGDGFTYRQKARAIVADDIRATLVTTAMALLAAAASSAPWRRPRRRPTRSRGASSTATSRRATATSSARSCPPWR